MAPDPFYTIKSAKECKLLIEANGVDIAGWPDYSIPSGRARVYILPLGQFVMVPNSLNPDYPGFIFRDKAAFLEMRDSNWFPIDSSHMLWHERHSPQVKHFLSNPAFYRPTLARVLTVSLPFEDVKQIKAAYFQIHHFFRSATAEPDSAIMAILYSFALEITRYLVMVKKYVIDTEVRYATYNPYYYPMVFIEHQRVDMASILSIYLENPDPAAFELFRRICKL